MNVLGIELEAQKKALLVRTEAGIGNGPISNIFELLERLKVLFLRYPAGENTIEGYAAIRESRRIVFTNSSFTYGKEIFTAAHELGHLSFDLTGEDLKIDRRVEDTDSSDVFEMRANLFAAHFLMPSEAVRDFFQDQIGSDPDVVSAKDVVAVQQYFKVSYLTTLYRLKNLGLLTMQSFENVKNYDGFRNLSELTKRCGFENELNRAAKKTAIPATSLRKMIDLYEQGRIPYGSLEYSLGMLGRTPKEFGLAAPKELEE